MTHSLINNFSKKRKLAFQNADRAEKNGSLLVALQKFASLLENSKDDLPIWIRIGGIQIRLGQWQQAADTFSFVLTIDEHNSDALHCKAACYIHLNKHEEAYTLVKHAIEQAPNNHFIYLTYAYLHCLLNPDRQTRLDTYKHWGEKYADPLYQTNSFPKIDRTPNRKLRVGYLSGDMREHSVCFFMEPYFANLNSNHIEQFIFSTDAREDQYTQRIKKSVPHWFNVSLLNDNQTLNLIKENKIDILVDLSGHTEGQRLFVFARRAAPVQVTWLGFMGTLGMKEMDYRLTDLGMDPEGSDQWYAEKLFRVDCMASYCPPQDTPLALDPPCLINEKPTLISLNNAKKISDETFLVWKEILEKRPDATLIIHVHGHNDEEAINNISPKLNELGLPLNQILVSPQVPLDEFMQRGLIADIALDTFPISGGTTTLHSLWMGLPVIAFDAEDAMSASTASTLKGLGLSEWVAKDKDDYVHITLKLMADIDRLKKHRQNIRKVMQTSVLMDYKARCAELEHAFKLMWFNYLLGDSRYLHSHFDIETETVNVLKHIADINVATGSIK